MPFVSDAYYQSLNFDEQARFLQTHLVIGKHPETHDGLYISDVDRYSGIYLTGVQGTGKSGLLENMILRDVDAENAVIVLDAHGDLMTNCLAALPSHCLKSVYLLDMEDEQFPFGVNIFGTGPFQNSIAHAQAVERILHVFEVLWPDVLGQQSLPRYVRAATITFLENPGATLVDMQAFLQEDSVRRDMLQNVTDPTVMQFWKTQYEDLSPAERLRRVQPLLTRLESLFMGRSLVRNILSQRQSTISFRRAIENKEVIFIRLPVKLASQDARLIGTIIMAQIHTAIFSFGDVPESKRPGVSLYVDEFQNFSSHDIAELFTEGRKFGMKLTVAHQYRNQLPGYLQDSTMTARTKFCFQLTPEDAREMAHVFPAQEEVIKPEDIEAHPVNYLLTYGSDHPQIKTFIETYLRPLQSQKRGGKVDIQGSHLTYDLWNGVKQREVYVADPTPYLDNLLYQVMHLHNPSLDIPYDVVWGFSNCGRGFFNTNRLLLGDDFLSSAVRFPPALVVQTADGDFRWTRKPESGIEQLYHFLFHLRITMAILAETPIGKKSAPSSTAVGQMLTNLPRRAAFVKNAETVGVIYTQDTRSHLQGHELVARLDAIRGQSRSKYARPKQDVEVALMQPIGAIVAPQEGLNPSSTSMQPVIVRWEDIQP